ncbi:MAG: hypothetical protein CMD25_00200, partial [Flavobacteriales bacterium]|nr:hypothetical protein [Flavobacteriales bacterium]
DQIYKYEKTLDLKQPSNDIPTLLKMAKKVDKQSYYKKLKQISKSIAGILTKIFVFIFLYL